MCLVKFKYSSYKVFDNIQDIQIYTRRVKHLQSIDRKIVTFSQTTNFKLFQIEKNLQMTILNLKNMAYGREFSKWVENTVGKGEIAHYEQFLLYPQCFQKACIADT